MPLTGLPEPTTGGQALQLWTARQAIEATLTSKIRSANESGGFQAMLQQALGDPNAGDPLPADLDTLAQQLTSTDPSVVAAATTAITTKLFMTVGQYHTLMKLRTMDADPNPTASRRPPSGPRCTRSSPPPRRPSANTRSGCWPSTAAGSRTGWP